MDDYRWKLDIKAKKGQNCNPIKDSQSIYLHSLTYKCVFIIHWVEFISKNQR